MRPSAPGSHSWARRGRSAPRRPDTDTSTRRASKRPWPAPSPDHTAADDDTTRSGASAHAPTWPPTCSSADPRSRARAWSRRWMPAATGRGGRTSTRSTASSRAATTPAHSAGPGSATSTTRSRSTPSSDAASSPSRGSPTTATHEPAAVTGPARARARLVAATPSVAVVLPRWMPPRGRSGTKASGTGRVRSPAELSGRTRSPRRRRASRSGAGTGTCPVSNTRSTPATRSAGRPGKARPALVSPVRGPGRRRGRGRGGRRRGRRPRRRRGRSSA
jgi:hypothetical protein